ncbi:hypothetical protein [Paenibacillus aquistagni]|uniref:hypothetical protein n=1 Tax=Paenibacillus aquistagni TaxID=1852522 RepID=UPI000B51170A|nr:hypothetical protein [Paenibacillus aquistagni]
MKVLTKGKVENVKAKKKILILFLTLLVLLLIVLIALSNYQALRISGITQSMDKQMVVLELENKGWSDIELLHVTINETQIPDRSELGVSYSSRLIIGSGLDEDPNIKFHANLHEIKITPSANNDERGLLSPSRNKPTDYGLRLSNTNKINNVTIKYKHFGWVYDKQVDLEFGNTID